MSLNVLPILFDRLQAVACFQAGEHMRKKSSREDVAGLLAGMLSSLACVFQELKVALNLSDRIFYNFVKSLIVVSSLVFNNKNCLLTGSLVSMVTSNTI